MTEKFIISKTFEFDYAHRVSTQEIKSALCFTCENKCRRIHGHTGKVKIFLKSDKLDKTGMITDYTNLKWFKTMIIDTYLDHKFLISTKYDSLWKLFIKLAPKNFIFNLHVYRPHQNKFKVLTFKSKTNLIKFIESNKLDFYELSTIRISTNDTSGITNLPNEIKDIKYLIESITFINDYVTAESMSKILYYNVNRFFEKYYNPKFKVNIKVPKLCFIEAEGTLACYRS